MQEIWKCRDELNGVYYAIGRFLKLSRINAMVVKIHCKRSYRKYFFEELTAAGKNVVVDWWWWYRKLDWRGHKTGIDCKNSNLNLNIAQTTLKDVQHACGQLIPMTLLKHLLLMRKELIVNGQSQPKIYRGDGGNQRLWNIVDLNGLRQMEGLLVYRKAGRWEGNTMNCFVGFFAHPSMTV